MISKSLPILALIPALSFGQDDPPPAITDPGPSPIPEFPSVESATETMKRAASYFRSNVSFAGGYAYHWPRDLSTAHVEGRDSPTFIGIQPPGTPSVGLAMLEAYRVTGDPLFLQAARETAQCLIWCQMASGGWRSDFDFDPRKASRLHFRRDLAAGDFDPGRRETRSSLDDNKTQSAIHFLLELAHAPTEFETPQLRLALDFALEQLLAAQAPNGGWPQQYSGPSNPELAVKPASYPESWSREFPGVDYTPFYTLNDGNLFHVMRLLLRAYELGEGERFLLAAKRLGEFLLLSQLPDLQPAWAQQYNFEMEPAWARKFEPPSVSSLESLSAINALIELWLATGDEKWVATIPKALDWLERSRMEDGRWARFYELRTNKPLYCKAETYEITYDDSNLPTHYGFKVDLESKIATIRKNLATGREQLLADRNDEPGSPKAWTSRAKSLSRYAKQAMASLKNPGVWLNDDGQIDARTFNANLQRMAAYVEAATNGGAVFRERHEKSLESKPVRVAGIVLKWVRGDKEANWDRAKIMIREAAENGAEIVVTTECFLDGYAIADKSIPLDRYRKLGEPIPDGKYARRLIELADELDIHLIAGMLEADGEERFNTAIVVSPDGELLGKYRKQNLGHELERNTPGSESTVFPTPKGDLGVMICADRRFPETVNGLIENGASLLICPSGGMFGPKTNDPILQERSRETRRYIIFVHPAEFLVTAPDGSIAARTILGKQLLVAPDEIDTDLDSRDVFYFDAPR